jgi:hypothetical protein
VLAAYISTTFADEQLAAEPISPSVTVELWMLDASLDKLSGYGIDRNGPIGIDCSLKEVFTSPAKARLVDECAPSGMDGLLPYLQSRGLVRILCHPKLTIPNGQKGTLDTGNVKFEATPVVKVDGRLRVEYRAEHNEPTSPVGWRGSTGKAQRMVNFTAESDSGELFLLTGGQMISHGPRPTLENVVFVRATLIKPAAANGSTTFATPAAATAISSGIAPAEQPPPKSHPQALTVQLKVVEVSTAKLKNLGFDWAQVTADGEQKFSVENLATPMKGMSVERLDGFLKALQQNSLARVLAEPTLVTLDGRPARLVIGSTQIDMVPFLLGDGRAKLECRLKTEESSEITADTELELGQMCLVRKSGLHDPRLRAQSPETEILVLARVEVAKPRELK